MAAPYMWFKVWLDILDDPKVHRLDDASFRLWINLLGFAKEHGEDGQIPLSPPGVAYRVRLHVNKVVAAIDKLVVAGLVQRNPDGTLFIPKFKKRQESPSTQRMRKWRNSKRHGDNGGDSQIDVTVTNRGLDLEENRKDLSEMSLSDSVDKSDATLAKKPKCQMPGCTKIPTVGRAGKWYCRNCFNALEQQGEQLMALITK